MSKIISAQSLTQEESKLELNLSPEETTHSNINTNNSQILCFRILFRHKFILSDRRLNFTYFFHNY